MTTATETKWVKYDGQHLSPGDEVKMFPTSRKLASRVGIFERRLQKNFSVIFDGSPWRVNPMGIESFRSGSISNLPAAQKMVVDCNPDGLADCTPGDIVLMWRGSFDVVKIVSVTPLRCEGMDRRCRGKTYRYNPEMFVQKLDSERFSS